MMTAEERAARVMHRCGSTATYQPSAQREIAAAIREAVAEEREACARIADTQDSAACEYIAEQIRARGKP